MVKVLRGSYFLSYFLLLITGCAPYVATQQLNDLVIPPTAEKNIFIEADPKETELVLIQKPLEEILASKGYKMVDSSDQASYTMRLHLISFKLKGHIFSSGSSRGSLMDTGMQAGALASSSLGAVAGFGAASLLLGGRPAVPFICNIEVVIDGKSMEKQQTILYAEAKVRDKNGVVVARQAVAKKIAAKIAALMP